MAAGRVARPAVRGGRRGGARAGALVLAWLVGSAPRLAGAREEDMPDLTLEPAGGGQEPADGQLPAWELVETPYGSMRLREFGSPSDPLVILVHGKRSATPWTPGGEWKDWNPAALQMAAAGFHVLLPDFHSGPVELRPGRLTVDAFRELMRSTLLPQNEQLPSRYRSAVKAKAVVVGKAWGAHVAAEAAAEMEEVVATALVVPTFHAAAAKELFPQIQGRLGVFLVKDDSVVDFEHTSDALRSALGDRMVTWVVAESGGHQLVPEFVAPLVKFVEESWESSEREEDTQRQRFQFL
ncbi:unnamed protein product [Prorocentrum cordatum]|uniref:AB hydrolase-1 domain-containing protein n=1 Tax=Prorocentrum cordatum TaxID=2364126 RepID=A0ABN9WTH8_9DINO|nr:unnamed protein product [Polarella glacialis]